MSIFTDVKTADTNYLLSCAACENENNGLQPDLTLPIFSGVNLVRVIYIFSVAININRNV